MEKTLIPYKKLKTMYPKYPLLRHMKNWICEFSIYSKIKTWSEFQKSYGKILNYYI